MIYLNNRVFLFFFFYRGILPRENLMFFKKINVLQTSYRKVLGSTPDRSTRIFFPSMPASFTQLIHLSHLFTRLNILHHIISIAHMPPIDIPILAVCTMFVPCEPSLMAETLSCFYCSSVNFLTHKSYREWHYPTR